MNRIILLTVLFACSIHVANCFQMISPAAIGNRYTTATITSLNVKVGDNEDGFPPSGDNSYDGDIDWDEEWKKVVKEKGQNADRPGKDFYKNDVERAAAKATRVANEQISKVKIVKPDINIRSLSGDARFWIAMLAILSVGLALISAPDTSSYSSSNESFYI
mmetsp:Transcript_106/g.123  ORF Transcript_106/g.123 Transcript_106/m.123 type:complete len:162 (+) Transcript_106:162-647(+)|eukprot:CAMPEP_0197247262 /NCGR_PEP_ID=MMETSP1429-20130617/27482_1 /TAXON_ID=49237 /ORGANISM="Chaetoceros  sp., Strain UNC1202" /LENGTH=161 /DNA_ID=CAMNT_0042708131 /DNA_START=98 /DNA_END=583 /DNA_ORIENTATION=+